MRQEEVVIPDKSGRQHSTSYLMTVSVHGLWRYTSGGLQTFRTANLGRADSPVVLQGCLVNMLLLSSACPLGYSKQGDGKETTHLDTLGATFGPTY